MKNLTLILVLITTFLCSSTAQEIKHEFKIGLIIPTHQQQNKQFVYGKVKEIHYVPYEGKEVDGKIVKGERLKPSEARGNILRQSWSYFFNEDGQVIKLAYLDDDFQTAWVGVLHYDNDKLNSIYWIHNDTLKSHHIITHLDDNRIEKRYQNPENGAPFGSVTYSYNQNGHLVSLHRYNREGQLFSHLEYERDNNGQTVTRTIKNNEGKVMWAYGDFTYDRGLRVKQRRNVANGEKVDEYFTRKYEFDKQGNWTKLINFGAGEKKSILIVERSIVYYEPNM